MHLGSPDSGEQGKSHPAKTGKGFRDKNVERLYARTFIIAIIMAAYFEEPRGSGY